MKLDFVVQDPTHAGTTYLYEAILDAVRQAREWRGLYAFATRDGIDQLIEDRVVQDMMNGGGKVGLVVGIDSVTNRVALERMQELEQCYRNFRASVFWNESSALFHPKVSNFVLADGGKILIVGSGNLTPGGLRGNFEAYAIVRMGREEEVNVDAFGEFLERHAGRIRSIDEEVLERAAKNVGFSGTKASGVAATGILPRPTATVTRSRRDVGRTTSRNAVLIAQVPRAGARWAQVHFNAYVVREYFCLRDLETQRVFLTRVSADTTRGEVEARACVYSAGSNRNHKIEVRAAKGLDYPQSGRPVLIFLARQLRVYDYMLLMPGDEGYGRIFDLSERLPSPGRGVSRPITDEATLARAWSDCPLLHVPPAADEEV